MLLTETELTEMCNEALFDIGVPISNQTGRLYSVMSDL